MSDSFLASEPPEQPSSHETRSLELELGLPASLTPGKTELRGYALYFVCSGADGQCVQLRQDFTIRFDVVKGRSRGSRRLRR